MTGYTRADSVNNIADGNIINASDLDGEFDAVQAAFNSSTGHVHDGTAANGAPITKIGPTQDVVASATALTPKTTATVDVGSSALKFKDFFFSGTGTLVGLTATGAITLNTTTNNQSYTTTGAGTITISSGTAGSINNMTIGGTTPLAGAFTTLSASSTVSGTGFSTYLASPPAIGGTSAAAISATTLTTSSTVTHNGGTANGVAYLNGSKVLTSGSAFVFDGTNVGIGGAPAYKLDVTSSAFIGSRLTAATGTNGVSQIYTNTGGTFSIGIDASTGANFGAAYGGFLWHAGAYPLLFGTSNTERMRIDSSGNVGIGTSSNATNVKLQVASPTNTVTNSRGNAYIYTTEAAGIDKGAQLTLGGQWTGGEVPFASIAGRAEAAAGAVQGYMQFGTINSSGVLTERMRIDSSGNVGIGTSSPAATLHSYKNTNNGTIGVAAILDAGTQNPSVAGGGIVMNFLTNTGATYFGAVGGYTDGTNYVTGLWGGAAASGAPALIVNSSGSVGIGTSSPQQPIHVYSSAAAGKYIYAQQAGSYNIGFQAQNSVSNWYAYTAASTGNFEFFQGSGSGNVVVVSPVGLGYGTGSGGTVTQATSRTTGVTLNKPTGAITLVSAAGSSTWQEFTVTNSLVTANDTFVLNQRAGADRYVLQVRSISAGSFVIAFQTTGGTTTEQPIFNFAIIKGATS